MSAVGGPRMSYEEQQAQQAIRDALQAIRRALEHAERVGYGSEVVGPLSQAANGVWYVLEVVDGRR